MANQMNSLDIMPFYGLSNYALGVEFQTSFLKIKDLLNENNVNLPPLLKNSITDEMVSTFDCKYYDDASFDKSFSSPSCDNLFSSFHVNLQSSLRNLYTLKANLMNTKHVFKVIGISETGNRTESQLANALPDYHCFFSPSKFCKGGVAVYVCKDTFEQTSVRLDISSRNKNIESIWVELKYQNEKILCGTLYRHPNTPYEEFDNYMREVYATISRENALFYIQGDINIDGLKLDNTMSQNFYDFILPRNIIPCIAGIPTRITDTTATQIDHICVFRPINKLDKHIHSGALLWDISDHLPVFFVLKMDKSTRQPGKNSKYTKRSYNDYNKAKFREKLQQSDWNEISANNNCNVAFDLFHDKFTKTYEECFPIKTVSRKRSKDKKWLTKGLLISIKHKNRLYRQHLKNRSNISLAERYKTYKNRLTNLLKKAEKEYYVARLTRDKSNINDIWKVYAEILGQKRKCSTNVEKLMKDHKTITDPTDISEAFNDYFANIGKYYARDFPEGDNFINYMGQRHNQSMYLRPITRQELFEHLTGLDKTKSPGIDDISPNILSAVADLITDPLLHVYNLSFDTGVFPEKLKMAKIIPLYKKNEHHLPGNYRPISLLSIFSKVLEKLMQKRLYSYLSSFDILFDLQFGFREKHSTTLALIEITDNIRREIDNGNSVIGIYLDLSKAFDTVCHQKLLMKLSHYGIRGNVYDWFQSYLSNRMQRTYVNKAYSTPLNSASIGVPQGSSLSPLLFLCYVNDIANVLETNQIRLFADDTNLFISGNDCTVLQQRAQYSLELLQEWFTTNHLTLNITKTCYSVFSKKINENSINLSLNGAPIPCVKSAKYLGVHLDHNLNLQDHCMYVKNKLTKITSACYFISKYINRSHVREIYFAYIFPHIKYGIEISGTSNKNVAILQKCQNRLIKTLCNAGRYDSPTLLHDQLGLFNIIELIFFNIACFVYKQQNGLLPKVFDQYFQTNDQLMIRSHRQSHMLNVPYFRLEFGKKSLSCIGAKIWNSIPENTQSNESIHRFKSNLKLSILEGTINITIY